MKIKRLYEIYSLVIGFAAIITLVFFLITSPGYCFILFEPLWFIRIPEIIIGISVFPYYLKKIYKTGG